MRRFLFIATLWLSIGVHGLKAVTPGTANATELTEHETKAAANPTTAPSNPPLTWAECVRRTIAHNPDLQASREAVLNSQAVKMGAYSQLYPQISASFGDTRSLAYAYGLNSTTVYATSYAAQVSLTQTIFNGFQTKGNIDQARAQLHLAFANLNAQKATTSYSLKSAFAQLLYSQELIVLSRNVLEIRHNNAHLVKLLYDGGTEDKGAMLLSKANEDQAVTDLGQAQRTYEVSGLQLAVTIGEDLPPPVVGEGRLVTQPLAPKPDFRQLALLTPAYFQKRDEADATAAGVTIAESGWYPTITANVADTRQDSQIALRNYGFSAGFAVSVPLFEGGQTYFNVKAATASLRQALASLQSGTDQAALTLAQGYKGMVDAEDNVRIQEELLEATALRYKIAEASYRTGLMSFQDFNSITDTYVNQQLSCLASQRDAVIAEANWELARGIGVIP
jgi:outer membrane protein TolC